MDFLELSESMHKINDCLVSKKIAREKRAIFYLIYQRSAVVFSVIFVALLLGNRGIPLNVVRHYAQ